MYVIALFWHKSSSTVLVLVKYESKCFFKLLCQGSKIAIGEADLVLFTSLKWGVKWNLVKIQ